MKDPKDKKTLPLIPDVKSRGRPSTGSALTPAQRKAAQRLRDREMVTENSSDATNTALFEQIQKAVSAGDVELVKRITLELMKRARVIAKEKEKVTVTKNKVVAPSKKVTVTKNAEARHSSPAFAITTKKNPPKPGKPPSHITEEDYL